MNASLTFRRCLWNASVLAIVFVMAVDLEAPIARAQIKLSDPTLLFVDVAGFSISADSSTVVYTEGNNLFSVPIGGGTATPLSDRLIVGDVFGDAFFISPDGATVVFQASPSASDVDLYSVPIGGGSSTKLNAPLTGSEFVNRFLISPDSSVAVYQTDHGSSSIIQRLFSVPISGGTATMLSEPVGMGEDRVTEFSISSDSNHVVYRADREDSRGRDELFSVPIGGGTVSQLDDPLAPGSGVDDSFLISPDSSAVVFATEFLGSVPSELFSVPIEGGTITKLNDSLVPGGDVNPNFLHISPDSNRVVYRADQDTFDEHEVYSVPIGGGTVTKLNEPLVTDGDVFNSLISPDSSTVVYVADQDTDNVLELYAAPIGGGTVTKLNDSSSTGVSSSGFSISPDGNTVIFEAGDLYSVPISGGAPIQINDPLLGGAIENAVITPDSSRVVYQLDEGGLVNLYTVPIGGGMVTRLNDPTGGPGGFDGDVIEFLISPNSSTAVYRGDQDVDDDIELYAASLDIPPPPPPPPPPASLDVTAVHLGGGLIQYTLGVVNEQGGGITVQATASGNIQQIPALFFPDSPPDGGADVLTQVTLAQDFDPAYLAAGGQDADSWWDNTDLATATPPFSTLLGDGAVGGFVGSTEFSYSASSTGGADIFSTTLGQIVILDPAAAGLPIGPVTVRAEAGTAQLDIIDLLDVGPNNLAAPSVILAGNDTFAIAGTFSVVPEPSALVLLVIGVSVAISTRRQSSGARR